MKARDMKKKFAGLLAALMMIALLSACGGNSENGGQSGEASASASAKETTATGDSGTAGEPVELSLFINHPWYPIKEWTGPIADKITEKTGVKLKVTVATDDKQLPVMIASGDLPDLIFDADQFDRLSNSNISYPWNELIEKYAPDFEIDPIRKAVNTVDDGNFYTVRMAFATEKEWNENKYALGNDGNPGIDVREDLLKELGNPQIKTLDDFVNVLGMVKEKYPDMVPLVMDNYWFEPYFMSQFGMNGWELSSWDEQDGKVSYGLNNPKLLDFFKFMNNLYRKGYIQAENFAFANSQIDDEYAIGGKAFAHSHTVRVADSDNLAAKQKGVPYTFKMIPTALTKDAVIFNNGVGWSGTYITKNNKNPEKSIKLLQYLASDEGKKLTMFGIEGEHWTWNEEGYPNLKYNPSDAEFVNKNGIKWWYLYSDAITEGLWSYVPGTQTTQALMEAKAITVYKPVLSMIQLKGDSPEKAIKTKLDEMVNNQKVKIYLAKSDAEMMKAYEELISNAKKIGMDKLEAYANQVYSQKKTLFE
ncbi:ABC transporter substrate-binding protein [Cohnella suwonensis]|uniref:ABC transporter substrate-binding protein n=1 Tax=Cohnella suwonensis TaxID=696072 RepID=A0ABW0M2B7_9BACL